LERQKQQDDQQAQTGADYRERAKDPPFARWRRGRFRSRPYYHTRTP